MMMIISIPSKDDDKVIDKLPNDGNPSLSLQNDDEAIAG